MKKLKSRLLSILMATVMLFGLLPLAAFAENNGAAGVQYSDFLASLTVLEEYADVYAREHSGEDATALVINYIRTGVESIRPVHGRRSADRRIRTFRAMSPNRILPILQLRVVCAA